MSALTAFWAAHGTKILGTLTAAAGAALAALPQLHGLISDRAYGITQFALSILVGVLGASTIKRGFTNSAAS